MSWAVSAVGKPAAVAAAIESQFAALDAYPCKEPEESIKQAVRQALKQAIAAQKESAAVRVLASGSMSYHMPDPATVVVEYNTLSVSVEPLYGFVE